MQYAEANAPRERDAAEGSKPADYVKLRAPSGQLVT